MREPEHNPHHGPQGGDDLHAPPRDEALQRAHAQAIQRLFERRCAQRESRDADEALQRRAFLRIAGGCATALASWGIVGRSVVEASRNTTTPPTDDAPTIHESGIEKVARFSWETVLFQCGQYATAHVARLCDLPLGNPGNVRGEVNKSAVETTIRIVGEDPLIFARLYGSIGVAAPIVEEVIFRILPAHLLFSEGMQWSVGIPATVAFAALHNIIPQGTESRRSVQLSDRAKLSLDLVPLPQFMLGAYCWYVMKRYGDWAPLVAHAINNQGSALSLVWGGRGTYREYQELLAEELQGEGPMDAIGKR